MIDLVRARQAVADLQAATVASFAGRLSAPAYLAAGGRFESEMAAAGYPVARRPPAALSASPAAPVPSEEAWSEFLGDLGLPGGQPRRAPEGVVYTGGSTSVGAPSAEALDRFVADLPGLHGPRLNRRIR